MVDLARVRGRRRRRRPARAALPVRASAGGQAAAAVRMFRAVRVAVPKEGENWLLTAK